MQMATAAIEQEGTELMTDHQMDNIISLILSLFENMDKQEAMKEAVRLIKDKELREQHEKKLNN
jgi:hypothetical protein